MPTSDHQEEFSLAFDLYSDAIFRHCSFRLSNREVSKELTQDAFLRYWQCLEKGEKIENTHAFLYKIANNLVVDYVRKKKEVSLDDLREKGFEPGHDDLDHVQNRLDGKHALEVLSRLEDSYQSVLTMRFVEGLEPWEIAEALGETPNTVSVRIHRGLKQLRSYLESGSSTLQQKFSAPHEQ